MNQEQSNQLLQQLQTFVTEVEVANETNEQWFIDFLDILNEISVSH